MWKLIGAFLFAAITITTCSGTNLDELLSAGSTLPTHSMTSSPSNPLNTSRAVPEFHSGHSVILSLPDPKNGVMPSTSSPGEILPTVHSVANVSMETASLNLVLAGDRAVETGDARLSSTEVVVIATGVTLLSLATVVISIAVTFLIRRRTRHKAYLRVRHASQAELCVHYVQNTAASVAARDAAMEQLFQSLVSIDPDVHAPDYHDTRTAGQRCMTPTESVASTGFVGAKSKPHSRSMPSLKNLNAHEEALNCTFTGGCGGVFGENPRRLGVRSRSLTERAAFGVDPTKSATRSHSERLLKNRLVSVPAVAAKRFEKTGRNKASRRSSSSFSRLAKFSVFGGHSAKQRKPVEEEEGEPAGKDNAPFAVESHSGARNVVAASDRKRSSNSLLDFKVPSMSLILHDIGPMLTDFQYVNQPITDQLPMQSGSPSDNTQDSDKIMDNQLSGQKEEEYEDRQYNNGRCNSHTTLQPEIQNSKINHNSDIAIYIDDKLEVRGTNRQKVPSFEEVRSKYLHGSSNQITKALAFSSVGHLGISCKDGAVGDHIKQTIS